MTQHDLLGTEGAFYAPADPEASPQGAQPETDRQFADRTGMTEISKALDRKLARRGTQGKCPSCRECYRWTGRLALSQAYCPTCGTKLRGTTHLNRWPWNEDARPINQLEAWQKFEKGRR